MYKIHDYEAIKELTSNAFILNDIQYDHNSDFLHTIEKEPEYMHNTICIMQPNEASIILEIDSLKSLPVEYENMLNLDSRVLVNGYSTTYGIAIINKWAGFKTIQITNKHKSNDISRIIYSDCKSKIEYHKRLNDLSRKLSWLLSVHPTETLTVPFVESCEIMHSCRSNKIINNLPNNPHIGHQIHKSIVEKTYESMPKDYMLYKLTQAFTKTRNSFARSIVGIGYISDNNNIVSGQAITQTTLGGLDEDEFFKASFGTRKGVTDKKKGTPDSGYLQRTMCINLSPVEITEDDCLSTYGFIIQIKNEKHANSLIDRYYSDGVNWKLFTEQDAKDRIGQNISFRSPITCKTENFKICKKCFGEHQIKSPFVGVLTGQYVAERLTQLTINLT